MGTMLAALAGALLYPVIELLWRGHTHVTMAFAGGLAAAAIWLLSSRCRAGSFSLRVLLSALVITLIELCFGTVFNLGLRLEVWNYSSMYGNLLGQICLPYFLLWILLSIPVCLLFARISDAFRS